MLADLPEDERCASWRLVRPGGPPIGYGRGGRELLLSLRSTRPLGRLLGVVPDGVLDAAYRLVARNRSQLGRLVPDRAGPRRYP